MSRIHWYVLVCLLMAMPLSGQTVEVTDNSLFIDGVRQPQIWGAELQYFRLRGGYGRNIPRQKVIDLWNRALDRMVEAKMNTISFYIPWDFHEYAEGKFDFTGTVDEDGDGNPDYPSRDIKTFFELIAAHGIKRIMVRPGPYINAEWGFLGFGAIPLWFHEKFPDSHMRNPQGQRTKVYDYHNADLLNYTKKWFTAVYEQVLKEHMGPGKPICFVQIDNETNFMWQSIFNHDYGPGSIARYREFLKQRYGTITELNLAHQRQWTDFSKVQAPTVAGQNISEDQDWYRFQDQSIYEYLVKIRRLWEGLGVKEPNVLFTLAESYDHNDNSQLVNFKYRNMPGETGMITMNLYSKLRPGSFSNLPFKVDHDVLAMDAANDYYFGSRQQWLMGPEIQAGWWRGTPVTEETRRQTYLSAVGHGLKAMLLYYFTEGDNWQSEWIPNQVRVHFDKLKHERGFERVSDKDLPQSFWSDLQAIVNDKVIYGVDARNAIFQDRGEAEKLYFDAPLDGDAQPRSYFNFLKTLGENLISPYGDFLATSKTANEGVVVLKDVANHPPTRDRSIDNLMVNTDYSAGLVGYLMQVGLTPEVKHFNLNPNAEIKSSRMIFYNDPNDETLYSPGFVDFVRDYVSGGGTFVSFIGTTLGEKLGLVKHAEALGLPGPSVMAKSSYGQNASGFSVPTEPMFTFEGTDLCQPILMVGSDQVGMRCPMGKGWFIQVATLVHGQYNSDAYPNLTEGPARNSFLNGILADAGVTPYWTLSEQDDRIVAFSRYSDQFHGLMLFVKSAHESIHSFTIRPTADLMMKTVLEGANSYVIRDLISGNEDVVPAKDFLQNGYRITLGSLGATVFYITAQ